MALWHLIASGIEATMRGTINYLVRQGRRLLEPSTAAEATDRVTTQMSMSDPEDILLTRQIANQQVQAIHTANTLTRQGQLPPGLTEPVSMTFPQGVSENYRYLVIVEETDPATGQRREHPIEVFANDSLSRQEVLSRAVDAVNNGFTPLSPPSGIDDDAVTLITRTAIISTSKRG